MPQTGGAINTPRPRRTPKPDPAAREASLRARADETDAIARTNAAHEIAVRVGHFNQDTVAKYPKTVAGLVKSSLSTDKLRTVADNLDSAWQHLLARNTTFAALHDPDIVNPTYSPEQAALSQLSPREQFVETTGGPSRLPATAEQTAARTIDVATGENPVQALASGFQAPFSAAFAAAGWALDEVQLDAVRNVMDPAIGGVEKGAAIAGRGAIGLPIGAAESAVADLGGKDTDWKELLGFWRLEAHDPITVGVANLMGKDVNDPSFADTAKTIDILSGAGEQIALAKIMVGAFEYARVPGNMGGLLEPETWTEHDSLNGRYFRKTAELFDKTPPGQHVAKLLQSTRRTDPRLARTLSEAYKWGDTKAAKIVNMKRAFVDYIKSTPLELEEKLARIEDGLKDDPTNVALRAEKASTELMLEDIAAKDPITEWPRYQDIRGVLKGSEPTTRAGKFVSALYKGDTQGPLAVTKWTDNLRNRFRIHDWNSPDAPADALRQNFQNVGRLMRSARVPNDVVALRLGEMLDPATSYSDWYMRMTHDIVESAKDWADPVTLKRIESTMRNDEMFTNRSNFSHTVVDPETGITSTVREAVLKRDNGTHPPTQMNEVSHGARAPALDDVRDVQAATARLKKNPGLNFIKKTYDQVMAGWRGTTITVRGPAIMGLIETDEGLTSFFTNTPQKLIRRTVNWVAHKLPLTEESQAAVAQRLGFADVHEARNVYKAYTPEDIGQGMANLSEETAKRIEVPSTRFNNDFYEGGIDLKSPLAKRNFDDLVWQIEHTATSPDMRTLMHYGPERTADLMLGQERPGLIPIPEGSTRSLHLTTSDIADKIATEGIKESARTQFGDRPAVNGSTDMQGAAARAIQEGTLGPNDAVIEYYIPPEDVIGRGVGSSAIGSRTVPPERIVKIYKGGVERVGSPDLERWYDTNISRDIAADSRYAGMDPRTALVEFLKRKESTLEELAGGHPEVTSLMADGRTSKFRLADPAAETDLIQEEIQQGHLNLADPETPAAQRLSLIERRDQLLERGEAETATPKRLKVSKNNAAIRKWLMDEAMDGRYKLPETRWTRVTPGGDYLDMQRGLLSKVTKVEYAVMKYMNADIMRGGFAEAKYLKWKNRYLQAGWTEAEAVKGATAQAAFEVRDWLHDIGNKSSFQRFLRNEVPFLHAWERVAYRWFVKIPNMMGAGFTPLGWAIESNIVHDVTALLHQTGVIKDVKNPDGTTTEHVYLPNPLALLNFIPKFEAPAQVDVMDPEHAFLPLKLAGGELPGLSPVPVFALDKLGDWTHAKVFKDLSNEFTMDGAFQFQFPGSGLATKTYEAITGEVPPWAIGRSKNYQEYVVGRAHDAALRYAYTELSKQGETVPNPADYDTPADYHEARDKYWAKLSATADQYFHGISWTYLLSAESPLSFRPTTQEETAWKKFLAENGLDGPRNDADYQLIDDYLSDHPESLAYNVSMYDRTSKWPEDKGYVAFRNAVADGDIRIVNYNDYRGALALAQEWDYLHASQATALQKVGLGNWDKMSAADRLKNWGLYNSATADSWRNFDEFLSENKAANRWYEKYKSPASVVYDKVQEVKDHYSDYKNPDAVIQKIYDKAADAAVYGTTASDHVKWYKATVMHDYYSKTNAIFDRIDALEASKSPHADDAIERQWRNLQELNNTWPKVTGPDGEVFPSPEEYYYAQKYPKEQQEQRAKWAAIPPAWLSEFAYETTYGPADGKTKAYFAAENQVQDYFDAKTAGVSTSSTEYDNWVKWREQALDILAKRNDVGEIRRLEKAPRIVRLQTAGLTPDTANMDWIVTQSNNIAIKARAQGWSVWGASEDAQYYRGWLENYISQMRDPGSPNYDAKVDQFFTRQARATGITFEPALYRFVLFGVTGGFEIKYDFSKENKMAGAH